jgi:hypothetical protein
MRLGVALGRELAGEAALVEELGFSVAWIDERAAPAPLAAAAWVAQRAPSILIAAVVEAGVHPVTLAEESAVADLTAGGRLVLVLRSADEPLLAETLEVLAMAWAGRPFRHTGARWRVPALLAEHAEAEPLLRVTPAPAQLEPAIWLDGPAAPAVAATSGAAFVARGTAGNAATLGWRAVERALGMAASRLRRPASVAVAATADGDVDVAALARQLIAARDGWGLDVAIVELPRHLDAAARKRALAQIAGSVRPRVQLARLPAGLDAFWDTPNDRLYDSGVDGNLEVHK